MAVSTCDPAVLDCGHCLLLNTPQLEPESVHTDGSDRPDSTHTHVNTGTFYILVGLCL